MISTGKKSAKATIPKLAARWLRHSPAQGSAGEYFATSALPQYVRAGDALHLYRQ